jgi:hypothetical protein
MLYIALALSKCSILILVQVVFKRNPKVSWVAKGAVVVVAIWGLVGILAVSIGCSPATVIPQPGSSYCVNSVSFNISMKLKSRFAGLVGFADN